MNEETSFVICKDVVPGPMLRVEHGNRYGSVAGLEDDELLGPVELERAVYQQEFGPVLTLPVKGKSSGIRPVVLTSVLLVRLILKGQCLTLTWHGIRPTNCVSSLRICLL